MNLLLFCVSTLLGPACGGMQPDTIILKAGNNSKVIFYGKSRKDLENLEKLDLNKILKDLNERQGADPEISKKVVLESADFKPEPIPQTRLQKYLSNTFLNLHVGKGGEIINRYRFYQPDPSVLNHTTARLSADIVLQNLLTTNFSLVHDTKLLEGKRTVLSARYGVGVGFNVQRYMHWYLIQDLPSPDASDVVVRAHNLMREENITPMQADFNSFQSFVQVAPRFSLKNKNGVSTFYASAGVRFNYNKNFENVNPMAYTSAMGINTSTVGRTLTISPVVAANNYSVRSDKQSLGISYLAEVGYKWIGLFMVYYPDYISLKSSTWSGIGDAPGAGFIEGKRGRIGYISFGLKLGR